jgi:GT2 family glycosyltransferase
LIRRDLIDRIGLLDEQFWIYGEEVDYCQTARHAGFETWYFSQASVVHHYGGMTAYSLRLVVWLYIGHKLYVEKHYRGTRKFLILFLKYLGSILRIIAYAAIGFLTLDRRLFTKAYYFWVGLYKVLTERVEYVHGYIGEAEPWTKYL